MCEEFPAIDLANCGSTRVEARDGSGQVIVEVIDSVYDHIFLLKKVFDFDAIRALLARPEFSFVYDSMKGVQGPYAKAVFCDELGAPASSLINAEPKDDFGGGHADPNLTYAKELVALMGLDKTGQVGGGGGGGHTDQGCSRRGVGGARSVCATPSLQVVPRQDRPGATASRRHARPGVISSSSPLVLLARPEGGC